MRTPVIPCLPSFRRIPRPGRLATGLIFLAGLALIAPPEATSGVAWGGGVRLDAEHTSDLFPGGDFAESASLIRLTLSPQFQFRVRNALRIRPWFDLEVERHDGFEARDLERQVLGVDLRHGPGRLRLYHGWTNHELYFPSRGGGAYLDRRIDGAELRLAVAPDIQLRGGIEHESDDFVPTHQERDGRRWVTRLGVERGAAKGLRTAATWFFRDTKSTTDLYTYRQNMLRLDVEGTMRGAWHGAARVEGGLRNYDTGAEYASNFGRQDHRWRARLAMAHPVAGPVAAEAYHAWRQTESSRVSKGSVVRTIGLALTYDR